MERDQDGIELYKLDNFFRMPPFDLCPVTAIIYPYNKCGYIDANHVDIQPEDIALKMAVPLRNANLKGVMAARGHFFRTYLNGASI